MPTVPTVPVPLYREGTGTVGSRSAVPRRHVPTLRPPRAQRAVGALPWFRGPAPPTSAAPHGARPRASKGQEKRPPVLRRPAETPPPAKHGSEKRNPYSPESSPDATIGIIRPSRSRRIPLNYLDRKSLNYRDRSQRPARDCAAPATSMPLVTRTSTSAAPRNTCCFPANTALLRLPRPSICNWLPAMIRPISKSSPSFTTSNNARSRTRCSIC